jgi:hypothetical protein
MKNIIFVLFAVVSAITFGQVIAGEKECVKKLYNNYISEREEFWQLVEGEFLAKQPVLYKDYSVWVEYEKLNTGLKKFIFDYFIDKYDSRLELHKPLLQWVPDWSDCTEPHCSNPVYEELSKLQDFLSMYS